MLIDLSELLSVKDKSIDIQAEIEMNRFKSKMADYPVSKKAHIMFHLTNIGKKMVRIEANFDITFIIPCDRCQDDVEYDMSIDVDKEVDLNESEQDRIESLDELNFIQKSSLDVEKLVYNEILVHLPMKVLCNDSCKGICNRCGANLNSQTCNCDTTELDPRMSKIRDIFNNIKEV